jgi:hypothetical protein
MTSSSSSGVLRVLTKTDAVGMFTPGCRKFDRYETSETKFRVYGATAIVTGRLRRTGVITGAAVDATGGSRKVYLRRTRCWQIISYHASNAAP